MTDKRKLENYTQTMARHGVSPATAFPPLWRMLWFCGVAVPPPLFLGFLSLTLFSGGFFGPVFALIAWLLGNRGARSMPFENALWVALITGTAFGIAMALYYGNLSRKHRLGTWAHFPISGLRT